MSTKPIFGDFMQLVLEFLHSCMLYPVLLWRGIGEALSEANEHDATGTTLKLTRRLPDRSLSDRRKLGQGPPRGRGNAGSASVFGFHKHPLTATSLANRAWNPRYKTIRGGHLTSPLDWRVLESTELRFTHVSVQPVDANGMFASGGVGPSMSSGAV